MISLLGLILLGAAPPPVCPVAGSVGRCIIFSVEWPAAAVPKYHIVVQEDLVAHYWEGDGTYDAAERAKPALHVSQATLDRIYEANKLIRHNGCETKQKNIALTGKKTLASYEGDEVTECTFNYSDEERLNTAVDTFQAFAETMQEGTKLAHEHRFDRLSLNAELDAFGKEAKAGRAIELENIAPVLQSIVDDDELMDVVRRKAQSLLQDASLHGAAK